VPGQILIAFVAEFRLYGFWGGDGLFAELLRTLEKDGATELGTRSARGGSMESVESIGVAWERAAIFGSAGMAFSFWFVGLGIG